jgi:DNA-binding response OmpR family regulator
VAEKPSGGARGPAILVLTEDDDVAEPLAALLGRAGYRVEVLGGRDGIEAIKTFAPGILILDRDLSPDHYRQTIEVLEARPGPGSFPLLVLGGGASPSLPRGWHEDAAASLSRPPQPGEVEAKVAALLRLAFYLPYRDLVHQLSQPVTTIHALCRSIARLPLQDESSRQTLDHLVREADRLMSMMETFQRRKAARTGGEPSPGRSS